MDPENVEIMIPPVRTLEVAQDVNATLKKGGLGRGKDGLR